MTKEINKLTRRQTTNQRAKDARYASRIMGRLRMSILGEPEIDQCECGKEYEVFPNQPPELKPSVVQAIKTYLPKVYPDISPEDFDKASDDEPKTPEELADGLIESLAEQKLIEAIVFRHPEKAGRLAETIEGLLKTATPFKNHEAA